MAYIQYIAIVSSLFGVIVTPSPNVWKVGAHLQRTSDARRSHWSNVPPCNPWPPLWHHLKEKIGAGLGDRGKKQGQPLEDHHVQRICFSDKYRKKWDSSIQWPFQGPKLEVPTIGAYWIRDVLRNPINFIHQPPAPCRNQSFFGCLSLEHAGNFEYLCNTFQNNCWMQLDNHSLRFEIDVPRIRVSVRIPKALCPVCRQICSMSAQDWPYFWG